MPKHHHTIFGTLPSFLALKARPEVRELFLNSAILQLAIGMVLIFEPIYLYKQGFSLIHIMFFYLGVYVLYLLIIPLGANFACKKGYEHSMLVSSPFWILYYASLFLVSYSFWFIVPAVVFLALQKAFYWPGFHADFAQYANSEETGREVSNALVITSVVQIMAPFIGGVIIKLFGFGAAFGATSLLILVAHIPTCITPERFKPDCFNYRKAYFRMFKTYNRRQMLGYLGFGEELVLLTLWPIFIFLILENAFSVGILTAISSAIAILVLLYVGKLSDRREKPDLLKFTTMIYLFSWLLRTITLGKMSLYMVHTFGSISKNSVSVSIQSLIYKRAKKYGVMKGVVLFESGLIIGKILAILLAILLLTFVGTTELFWFYIFLFAGAVSLLYRFL